MAWTARKSYMINERSDTDLSVQIIFSLESNLLNNASLPRVIHELQTVHTKWCILSNEHQWKLFGGSPRGKLERQYKEDWIISRDPFKVQITCCSRDFDSLDERDRYISYLHTLGYIPW